MRLTNTWINGDRLKELKKMADELYFEMGLKNINDFKENS